MPQLLPTSDQAVGSWTTSPLWSKVDDDSVVAATGDGVTITSDAVGNNTNTTNADLKLDSGTDPGRSSDHVIRVRWSRSGSASLQAHCELWQGIPGTGTQIASLDSATDVGATEVAATLTLTGTQADNITDYTDLYLRLWGRGTAGGAARSLIVELVEFAIPAVLTQHQKVSYDSEADSTTHSLTITEPTEGRLMVLVACASAVLNTPSGWSLAISATNDPDVRIFYRIAPASFGTTVQFGSGSSCSASAVFMEYSPIDGTPLDRTASQPSVAQTGTTATTTQADELLIAALGAGGTNADNNWSSWANSFVEEHDLASSGGGFNITLGVAVRVVAGAGTFDTSATAGAGSGPCGCIVTFKVGTAGGTTVNGTGLGAFTFTGAASGVPRTPGTAAGSFTFTGTASGTPDVQGQAAAAFTFTGSASGTTQATVTGTGSGAFSFTATATGAPETFGTAEAALSFAGAAAGVPDVQGAASASVTFTAAASGNPDVQGQAVGAYTFTGAASGVVEGVATGTGLGVFTFTGTAAGTPDVQGTAAAALAFSADAIAVRIRLGQAIATITFDATALGAPILSGQGAAAFTFTGAASGAPVDTSGFRNIDIAAALTAPRWTAAHAARWTAALEED
jgi:hypothetical protein